MFWAFKHFCLCCFVNVELATCFNYSYVNFMVGGFNEFNDN